MMLAALALALAPAALPEDGWIAFEQPLVEGVTRMGCTDNDRVSLTEPEDNWTVNDSRGVQQDRFTVYVNLDDGVPRTVRAYTAQCEVTDADLARKVELPPAQAVEMIDGWLQAGLPDRMRTKLFATLAHIDDDSVNAVLSEQAKKTADKDSSQDALFWLANVRGEAGRKIVVEHTTGAWPLDHRKRAVMSLGLSGEEPAFDVVRRIARDGKPAELREHAVTALGINHAPGALADLHSIFMTDTDPGVREQAIFGLAQLDSPEAAEVLLDIARNPQYGEHRREALFWLANMQDNAGGELLDELVNSISN